MNFGWYNPQQVQSYKFFAAWLDFLKCPYDLFKLCRSRKTSQWQILSKRISKKYCILAISQPLNDNVHVETSADRRGLARVICDVMMVNSHGSMQSDHIQLQIHFHRIKESLMKEWQPQRRHRSQHTILTLGSRLSSCTTWMSKYTLDCRN